MSVIKMVDLQQQYLKIKPEIDNEVLKVIHQGNFIQGSDVNDFSLALSKYLNVKHVITCANGTDAIQIALMALDLPKGSEVLIPSFSYISAAETVVLLGLIPVFIEANYDDFNLDVDKIESFISERTRAIIPIHLFGHGSKMLNLLKVAQKYNLFIIEDNAQSIGADYFFPDNSVKKLGTIGHIGTTSFFPSKNLGCMGDGGAIFTNDDLLADKIRCISNHGQKIKYYHDEIGVNSRLDTIQAAILKVKLKHLANYIKSRQESAAYYDERLASFPQILLPIKFEYSDHVYHQYTIKVSEGKRDDLKKYLNKVGIPTMVYYPLPIHSQSAYKKYDRGADLHIATKLSNQVLSLPMHTELDKSQIDFIIENIAIFFGH